jgi:cation-transporting ATPase E
MLDEQQHLRRGSQPEAPLGLTEADAEARLRQGLGNRQPTKTTRTYLEIARENLFTVFNISLFSLGIALIIMGQASDTLVTVSVVLVNVVVSVIQEVRAKRMLDRIALLTRPRATVWRDGHPHEVALEAVVQGDVVHARPGDQYIADGPILAGQGDVDESLLTGEADAVTKHVGDWVSAGTFCVSGMVYYRAERVGAASTATTLAQDARRFRTELTPLQREINQVIQIVFLVGVFFEVLIVGNALLHHLSPVETVQRSVVVLTIIPIGLFLAITVAYALGAMRIVGHGALIQQSNAIESLSHVDLLCLDKTGTITANTLRFADLVSLTGADAESRRWLGDFAANVGTPNPTIAALATAFSGMPRRVTAETPFTSGRKWSALAWAEAGRPHLFVLGAPEMLAASLSDAEQQRVVAHMAPLVQRGLRVVLFARAEEPTAEIADEAPRLPPSLVPVCLVALADTLRPEAKRTLANFAAVGIQVKIISGDHPETVAAVARQAGIKEARLVSGVDLAQMDDAHFAQVAETATIFGRISQPQKARLVQALRSQGHYVAMIGDGVNDVMALKQAQVGIALQSGSQATRSVADMVLLQDTFAPLPVAFQEGQRIRNGLHHIVLLFLARVLFVAVMILSVVAITDSFALTPKQNSLLAFIAGGVPALALAVWARPRPRDHQRLWKSILQFSLPAGLVMSGLGLALFIGFATAFGDAAPFVAQTALTEFGTLCGLALMLYVVPLTPFWAVREPLEGDARPIWLAVGLLALFALVVTVPGARRFFELTHLTPLQDVIVFGTVGLWLILTHLSWRFRLIERWLSNQTWH